MAEANRLFRTDQYERQPRDFYPTPAWATECLTDTVPLRGFIWEPCDLPEAELAAFMRSLGGDVIEGQAEPLPLPAGGRDLN